MDTQNDHLLDALRVIFRWKKPIMGLCAAVAAGSIIVTLLLPNYYKASTVFYPVNQAMLSPDVIFGTAQRDIEFFGESEDVDRLLSIAFSNELLQFMVDSFRLYEVYDITPGKPKARYKVMDKFLKHYECLRNERGGVELAIEDRQPERAAQMANAARDRINAIAQRLSADSRSEMLYTYEQNIQQKDRQLRGISDSLRILQKQYGIYDVASQSEFLSNRVAGLEAQRSSEQARQAYFQQIGQADSVRLIEGRLRGINSELALLTDADGKGSFSLSRLNAGMTIVKALIEQQEKLSESLSEDLDRYHKLKAVFEGKAPAVHVQDMAELPDIKSWPRRSIMVLGATFLALVLGIVAALLLDHYRHVDWKALLNGE